MYYLVVLIHGCHDMDIVGRYKTLKDAKRAVAKYSSGSQSVLDGRGRFWAFAIREEQ